MTKLIDFVAHPECNDLHVMAVMVLANLLEDLESLEVNKVYSHCYARLGVLKNYLCSCW